MADGDLIMDGDLIIEGVLVAGSGAVEVTTAAGKVKSGALDSAGDQEIATLTVGTRLKLGASGKSRVWFLSTQAGKQWTPDTDAACGGPTARKITNCDFLTLDFDASTDEVAYCNILLPPWYDGGQLLVELFWTALSGSGNVVWVVYMKCLAHDAVITAASLAGASVTATLTAANDVQRTEFSITPNGAAGNTWLQVLVRRDADAAGDTLAVDALMIGMNVSQVQ